MKADVDSKTTFWLRRPDLELQAEYTAATTNLMEFKQYLEQIKSRLAIGPEPPGDETQDQETDSTTGSSSEETSPGEDKHSSGDDNPLSGDDKQPKILKLSVIDGEITAIAEGTPQTVPTGEREGVSEVTDKKANDNEETSESEKPGIKSNVVPRVVEEIITPVTVVVPPIVLTGEVKKDAKETIKNEEPGNKPDDIPRSVEEAIVRPKIVSTGESEGASDATGEKVNDTAAVVPATVGENITLVIDAVSEDSNIEPSLLKCHKSTIIVAGICIIVAVGGFVIYYLFDGSHVPS